MALRPQSLRHDLVDSSVPRRRDKADPDALDLVRSLGCPDKTADSAGSTAHVQGGLVLTQAARDARMEGRY